ncbi:serine/threonine protein kinase [Streptomyces sp. Je 1-332]|uniref:serine/threonine protein kinase n=1 Tax=Streptomyces sp. Je 1-332 TaxID=3231270 RepID=UPI003457588E
MHAEIGEAGRRTGPYTALIDLDDGSYGVLAPERRFVARGADADRMVLISIPLPGTDPQRFMAEAEASRYLLSPWACPAVEIAGAGEPPWHARPYLPMLPLPTALAVHGGPLPERTVLALGAALAESLAICHGQGLTHAGISPAALFLAADGPRLTGFGAVRVAAPDGTSRAGLPGLEPGSLPPEQAAGGRPRPLGDVYALGATLAYAATGHTTPEREELTPVLRTVIGRCLSRDPQARPQLTELMDTFLPAASQADSSPNSAGLPATPATYTAGPTPRATALLGPGWLPGRVIAALAHQSSVLLAAERAVPSSLTWAPPVPYGAHSLRPGTPPVPSAHSQN